ncbi:hypothetical protein CEK27_011293 [Fusarium fujikuroi]|uniref:Uncharacterized protein n=1 Tax=Fusarium fujikuroi TaxID=5127 RepID=A0A9Q9UDR2_FUSFU|nr:hypothetical protein CEK27_011293 [Fusarium fujikuroi]QGI84553.1 hypothetical protein CEK25_011282 [Fusarium fujikuroi]VTT62131.1 unnamed protein product [Fusarium fujikuroi]VTT76216.1 unnamed protein product [Fusarium fujikuroi]VZH88640.1 unnamed protein product [Fusarium fujikuroi]
MHEISSHAYRPIKGHARLQKYLTGKSWGRILTIITPDLGIMTPDCPHEKVKPHLLAPAHRNIIGSDPRSLMRPTTFQVRGPVSQEAPGGRDAVTRMAGLDGAQPFSGRLQGPGGVPQRRCGENNCGSCKLKLRSRNYALLKALSRTKSLASQSPSGPTRGEENWHGAKHILTIPAKVSRKVDLQQLKADEVLPQDKDCIQSFPYRLRVREANAFIDKVHLSAIVTETCIRVGCDGISEACSTKLPIAMNNNARPPGA